MFAETQVHDQTPESVVSLMFAETQVHDNPIAMTIDSTTDHAILWDVFQQLSQSLWQRQAGAHLPGRSGVPTWYISQTTSLILHLDCRPLIALHIVDCRPLSPRWRH
eukprot:1187244-Prorocentrum_minimum.AAC.4